MTGLSIPQNLVHLTADTAHAYTGPPHHPHPARHTCKIQAQ